MLQIRSNDGDRLSSETFESSRGMGIEMLTLDESLAFDDDDSSIRKTGLSL